MMENKTNAKTTKTFEEELETHGNLVYTNVGVSMMPLIRQGRDLMVIEKRPQGRLKKYDAVLFKRRNGQYILHRILKVRENDYFIVGDNCTAGEYVKDEQILGVLVKVVRKNRTINITDKDYLFYVHLWCDLYPIRVVILTVWHFIRRVGGKILRTLHLKK